MCWAMVIEEWTKQTKTVFLSHLILILSMWNFIMLSPHYRKLRKVRPYVFNDLSMSQSWYSQNLNLGLLKSDHCSFVTSLLLTPQILYFECLNTISWFKRVLELNYLKIRTTLSLIAKLCLLQDNVRPYLWEKFDFVQRWTFECK